MKRRQRRVWTWVTSQLKPHSEKVAAHCFHLEYQTWTSSHHILKCTKLSLWQTKTWKSHWLWLIDRPHESIMQKLCNFRMQSFTLYADLRKETEERRRATHQVCVANLQFTSFSELKKPWISWRYYDKLTPEALQSQRQRLIIAYVQWDLCRKSLQHGNNWICGSWRQWRDQFIYAHTPCHSVARTPWKLSKYINQTRGALQSGNQYVKSKHAKKTRTENRIKIRTKKRVFRNLSNGGLLQGPEKFQDPQVLFPPPFFCWGGGGIPSFLFYNIFYSFGLTQTVRTVFVEAHITYVTYPKQFTTFFHHRFGKRLPSNSPFPLAPSNRTRNDLLIDAFNQTMNFIFCSLLVLLACKWAKCISCTQNQWLNQSTWVGRNDCVIVGLRCKFSWFIYIHFFTDFLSLTLTITHLQRFIVRANELEEVVQAGNDENSWNHPWHNDAA